MMNDHVFQDVYLDSIKQYKKLYETMKKTDDKVRKLQMMKDNEHTSKNMSRTTTLSLSSSMSDSVKATFIAKQKAIDEKANSDSRDNALAHETLHRNELITQLTEHMFTLKDNLTSFLNDYTSSSSSSSSTGWESFWHFYANFGFLEHGLENIYVYIWEKVFVQMAPETNKK